MTQKSSSKYCLPNTTSLLALIALSAAQSSAQTHIHSAILVTDISNNASYNQVLWLVRMPYLSIKASNGLTSCLPDNEI